MPIYDCDGTTTSEIKKVADWDGTTTHWEKKGYDWDGTAAHLFYSAAETFSYNSWDISIFTEFSEGTSRGDTEPILFNGTQLQYNIAPTGLYGWFNGGVRTIEKIDLTDYKTISVDVNGACWVADNEEAWARVNLFVREEIGKESVRSAHLAPPSSFETLTLDVSDLVGSYYVGVSGQIYNGTATRSQYNFRARAPMTFTAID